MECVSRYGKEKIKYETQELAQHVAERMKETYNQGFNVYCCTICNKWHVGRLNGHETVKEKVSMEGK